jgi:menaquinone-dependent protoporphyrinogen oxidase
MQKKILVVYASKSGSTAEVAQKIGQVLGQAGTEVEVCAAGNARNLENYDGFVLGTAIRMFKPLGEMRRFVFWNKGKLSKKPVAIFSVGLTLKEDTPENREKAAGYIAPITKQFSAAVSVTAFAGKLDYATLPGFFRQAFAKDTSGAMAEGDFRDWNAIQAWAAKLPALLGLAA